MALLLLLLVVGAVAAYFATRPRSTAATDAPSQERVVEQAARDLNAEAAKLLAAFWHVVEERFATQRGKFMAFGDTRGHIKSVTNGVATIETAAGSVRLPVRSLPPVQAAVLGTADGEEQAGRLARAVFLISVAHGLDEAGKTLDAAGEIPHLAVYRARLAQAAETARIAGMRADGWEPLFDGQSLGKWKRVEAFPYKKREYEGGKVTVADGAIVLAGRQTTAGAVWTGDLRRMDYELTFQARRRAGSRAFCHLVFPVGDAHLGLWLGGMRGGGVGLDSIDGRDAFRNRTYRDVPFETGQWVRVHLKVTPVTVHARVDGKELIRLDTERKTLEADPYYAPLQPLGFAARETTGEVRDLWTHQAVAEAAKPPEPKQAVEPKPEPKPAPWASLFDGKSLKGWRPQGGRTSNWRVLNDALVNAESGADLMTEGAYANFQLHLEFKIPKDGNSGVYLRGHTEVQIADSYGKKDLDTEDCGALWHRVAPRVNAAKPAGSWNTFDLAIAGDRIKVLLNGTAVLDTGEEGDTPKRRESARPGPIILQGRVSPVMFREIRIRPLP